MGGVEKGERVSRPVEEGSLHRGSCCTGKGPGEQWKQRRVCSAQMAAFTSISVGCRVECYTVTLYVCLLNKALHAVFIFSCRFLKNQGITYP